jgi:hypothetical protein
MHRLCCAARIIRRARIGNLLDHHVEPLGMFHGNNGQRYTIWGHHMAKLLKDACFRAHPDANHYTRLHIDQFMAHCLRVTAAVLLSNAAGVPVDDILFCLRWNSDAVLLHIRDNDRSRQRSFGGRSHCTSCRGSLSRCRCYHVSLTVWEGSSFVAYLWQFSVDCRARALSGTFYKSGDLLAVGEQGNLLRPVI